MNKQLEKFLRHGKSEGLPLEKTGTVKLDAATESKLMAHLTAASPMRRLSSIRVTRAGCGHTGELYAMPTATAARLDDMPDLDDWLATEVRDVFAAQETAAFINGDGINKPRGIMLDADKIHTVGVGKLTVGAVVALIYAVPSKHRARGAFIANSKTMSTLRALKDSEGYYIWQLSADASAPSTLLGYPCVEVADMPDQAPDALPIAFGDWAAGYQVRDRQGIHVLRDPYSAKPHVLFYTTKRVGGSVADAKALAFLRIVK